MSTHFLWRNALTYAVNTYWKSLNERFQTSTHNSFFHGIRNKNISIFCGSVVGWAVGNGYKPCLSGASF